MPDASIGVDAPADGAAAGLLGAGPACCSAAGPLGLTTSQIVTPTALTTARTAATMAQRNMFRFRFGGWVGWPGANQGAPLCGSPDGHV
ncbi:MAG: hypothetical protein U0R77_02740 [Mycolicibacterium insubricum]